MKVGLVDLVTPPCGKNLTTVKKIDKLNISSMSLSTNSYRCLAKKKEKNKKLMCVNPLNPKIKI